MIQLKAAEEMQGTGSFWCSCSKTITSSGEMILPRFIMHFS